MDLLPDTNLSFSSFTVRSFRFRPSSMPPEFLFSLVEKHFGSSFQSSLKSRDASNEIFLVTFRDFESGSRGRVRANFEFDRNLRNGVEPPETELRRKGTHRFSESHKRSFRNSRYEPNTRRTSAASFSGLSSRN